jgi:hypothetical protein
MAEVALRVTCVSRVLGAVRVSTMTFRPNIHPEHGALDTLPSHTSNFRSFQYRIIMDQPTIDCLYDCVETLHPNLVIQTRTTIANQHANIQAIARAYGAEPFWGVRCEMARALAKANSAAELQELRTQLRRLEEEVQRLKGGGWEIGD